MPTLPRSPANVQAVTAFILCLSHQSSRLYSAYDVAHTLNSAANVDGSVETSTEVDASVLLGACANDAADKLILAYGEHYCYCKDRNIWYVCKTKITDAMG